jgi:hypothetical protein
LTILIMDVLLTRKEEQIEKEEDLHERINP